MSFSALPVSAGWQHRGARAGFEVAYFQPADGGYRINGCTTAVEDGQTWVVSYAIRVDETWTTRSARIEGRSASGVRRTLVEEGSPGSPGGPGRPSRWRVDGQPAPHLDGCLDVDLESSAMTNALPVHRMALSTGARASAPAAYVRALDLGVERLDQEYVRAADEGPRQRYDYRAPAFGFSCRLAYDESGLVLDYPGIAVRAI